MLARARVCVCVWWWQGFLSNEQNIEELQHQHSSETARIHHPGQAWSSRAAALTGMECRTVAAAGGRRCAQPDRPHVTCKPHGQCNESHRATRLVLRLMRHYKLLFIITELPELHEFPTSRLHQRASRTRVLNDEALQPQSWPVQVSGSNFQQKWS